MIKHLKKYYKKYIKLLLLDIICSLGIVSIDLLFPMITRYSLQKVLPNNEYTVFVKIIILMGILYLFRAICEFIVNYYGNILGIKIERDLRNDLFRHIQSLSIDYFDKTRTGEIISRIISDLGDISELAHKGIELIILSSITFIGSFILLLKIQWRLALIVYAFIPFLIIFAVKQRLVMKKGFASVKKEIGHVASRLENAITGIRIAKSYGNEEYEIEKFKQNNECFSHSKKEAYKSMAVFISGINIVVNMLNVIVISVGGYFVAIGIMDVADLLTFMLFVSRFLLTVKRITALTKQYESGMAGIKRFSILMNEKPSVTNKKYATDISDVCNYISFNNVTFSYEHNNNILKDISMNFTIGKKYALVGMSGSGKSTVCRLLQRNYDIQSGSIMIDDLDIRDITIKSLRNKIGVVEQDVFLFADTIKENIRYGRLDATDKEIIDAAKKADIHDFIIKQPLSYDTYVGERGIMLSGGQKQRVSIARMFLKNPEIVIMDEATSALDNRTEKKIQKAMDELAKGRTAIIIAHRLSTIKHVDEIFVLDKGKLVERGTHDSLMKKKGVYSSMNYS